MQRSTRPTTMPRRSSRARLSLLTAATQIHLDCLNDHAAMHRDDRPDYAEGMLEAAEAVRTLFDVLGVGMTTAVEDRQMHALLPRVRYSLDPEIPWQREVRNVLDQLADLIAGRSG
jgi:hypothetical protein